MTEAPRSRGLRSAPTMNLIAGGIAGISAKTVVAPLERVKLLNQTGEAHGLVSAISAIGKKDGLTGYWKGNAVNCMRVFPSKGVLFGSFGPLKEKCRWLFADSLGRTNESMVSLCAGSFAGILACVATYPLDLARTRLAGRFGSHAYMTLSSAIRKTVEREGILAIYRGLLPTLVGVAPYEGLKFFTFDYTKRLWLDAEFGPNGEVVDDGAVPQLRILSPMGKVCCGSLAGMTAGIALYPNGTVRKRLQLQGAEGVPVKYTGTLDCYATLIREKGFRILYRGMGANLLRAIPSTGIQFTVFETLREMWATPNL